MPTVAIDFDGVIHAYSKGWHDGTLYDGPAPGAAVALAELMEHYAVYVFTTRSALEVHQWFWDNLPDIRTGVVFDRHEEFWNERGKLLITSRKLPAIAYIDDRAVHHTGDWDATIKAVTALDPEHR